jgi:hypothetical protein
LLTAAFIAMYYLGPYSRRQQEPRHPAPGCVLHRGELCPLRPPRAAQPTSPAYSGGGTTAAFIVPPPRRRASPSQKTIGGVCSFRFTALRSGRKPVLQRLKGGGAAPGRSRGPGSRKKRKRPCLRFFPHRRLPASPPLYRRNGAYFARPAFRLPITHSVISPTAS